MTDISQRLLACLYPMLSDLRQGLRHIGRGVPAALVIASMSALIVGCATRSEAVIVPPNAAPMPSETRSVLPAGTDGVPNVNITGALLYQLMAAELSLQNGDGGTAYVTYIAVAKQVRDARLARRALEIAIGSRALPQALDAAQLWRELAPGSAEALQASAALLVANNRYSEATPLFAEQIKTSTAPAEELARVQRSLARAPDRNTALSMMDSLAAPYRDDSKIGADVRLTLAAAAYAAGQPQRAQQEAQSALALRPGFERAALMNAQLIAQQEGKDERSGRAKALQALNDFVTQYPQAAEVRSAYARLLVADNRYREAQQQFQEIVKQDQNNLDALYALAVLSLELPNSRGEARRLFERYLKLLDEAPSGSGVGSGNAASTGTTERDPDPVYLNLARLAEDERKYSEALSWLDKVDSDSQRFVARLRKALLLGKMKRVEDGRKLLVASKQDSEAERTQLVVTEGQLLREAGRSKEAFSVLSSALAQAPEDTTLLYETAMAAEKLNRLELMETHLRKLMQLKPNEPHAYNALGYSFADRNVRLPEAQQLLTRALELAPNDGYIMDSMGWVLFRQGKLEQARDYLQRAYEARPHAEVGAHLGEVLWLNGQREQARQIWREALGMERNNSTLRATLKRFKLQQP